MTIQWSRAGWHVVGLCMACCLAGAADQRPFDFNRAILAASEGGDMPHLAMPDANGRRRGYLDGFSLQLDGAQILAHRLDVSLRPVGVSGGDHLDTVRLLPGPLGPEPERVHFDTRKCTIETINIRTLIRPKRMLVNRLPPQQVDGGFVLGFRIRFEEVSDFAGLVRDEKGEWAPLSGTCHHVEMDLLLDWSGTGVGERARLQRLRLLADDTDEADRVLFRTHRDRSGMVTLSRWFTAHFLADGRFERGVPGPGTEVRFSPSKP